jgi:uncharacterized repeat protein (TIGR03803 family)
MSRRMSFKIAVVTFAIALPLAAQAQTYSVIHSFTGGYAGSWPWTDLTITPNKHIYGTTFHGGPGQDFYCQYTGCGTIFELYQRNGSWVFNPLYDFRLQYGGFPKSAPLIGPDGALYGASLTGGQTNSDCINSGCGTIYKLQPSVTPPGNPFLSWHPTITYAFTGSDNDGGNPGGIIQDQSGNFFGADGGAQFTCGLVYELRRNGSDWSFEKLYDGFDCHGDYETIGPGGLVLDPDGSIYGITYNGGSGQCTHYRLGCGTVFQLTHTDSGWVQTTLHEFNEAADGGGAAGLVRDAAGNLYGGTESGGSGGGGTVWELSPGSGGGWTFQLLYSFPGSEYRGPIGRMVFDAAGNLYGVTQADGAYQYGNVFKFTPSGGGWAYTDVHDFSYDAGGAFPMRGPSLDNSGNIYGTTMNGGIDNQGVVWMITP